MALQDLLVSADSLSFTLAAGGQTTSVGPVGQVSGIAPPAFHHTVKIGKFDSTYDLDAGSATGPVLQIDTTDLTNTASSDGFGIDAISAVGTSDIAAASISLVDPLSSTLELLGLSVSATFIHSESNASYVVGPNRGGVSGDASFGSLTITGALVGGKTLTFSGDAAPNTVLFKSAAVTITLDQQTASDFLPPVPVTPGAIIVPPFLPNRITTDALSIQFNNAALPGTTVSGHIGIGESSASLFTSPIILPPGPVPL